MNDLISGGTTVPKAREIKNAATEIFADAAFELHKCHSNVTELESTETDQTADQTFAKQQLGISSRGESSLLGLKWDKLKDFLSVTVPTEKADNIKRGILAKIARIYDPLGAASPLTLCGKLLYHDACNLRIGWDEQLPSDLAVKWAKWESRSSEKTTFMRALVSIRNQSTVYPYMSLEMQVVWAWQQQRSLSCRIHQVSPKASWQLKLDWPNKASPYHAWSWSPVIWQLIWPLT